MQREMAEETGLLIEGTGQHAEEDLRGVPCLGKESVENAGAFAAAFEGMSQSLIDADKVFPVIDGKQGYCPDPKEWISAAPYLRVKLAERYPDELSILDRDGSFSDAAEMISQGVAKQPGQMIIVTGGNDAFLHQIQARILAENKGTVYSIREMDKDENLWPCKVVGIDEFEPVPTDDRPQVVIIGGRDRNNVGLNAAIAAVLSKAFDVVEEPIGFGHVVRRPKFSPDMFFFPTCYDVEFRWTDLHQKLSLQGTRMKLERQQQRRKALFKFHEKKRVKRGKEHAKQKHKGVSRFR